MSFLFIAQRTAEVRVRSRRYASTRLVSSAFDNHVGFHGDLNATYPVGTVDKESLDLMFTTKRAMEDAIAICKPGVAYREIGNKIEEVVKPMGYSIVRRYTGHGIHSLVSGFETQVRGTHTKGGEVPLPA